MTSKASFKNSDVKIDYRIYKGSQGMELPCWGISKTSLRVEKRSTSKGLSFIINSYFGN